jgi:hypothetical protein
VSDSKQVSGEGLGWWVIAGEAMIEMLRRAAGGEDPDMIYTEEYANSEHEKPEGAGVGRREDMYVNVSGTWGDYVMLDEFTECSNNSVPVYLLREVWESLGAPEGMTITVVADAPE